MLLQRLHRTTDGLNISAWSAKAKKCAWKTHRPLASSSAPSFLSRLLTVTLQHHFSSCPVLAFLISVVVLVVEDDDDDDFASLASSFINVKIVPLCEIVC